MKIKSEHVKQIKAMRERLEDLEASLREREVVEYSYDFESEEQHEEAINEQNEGVYYSLEDARMAFDELYRTVYENYSL